MLALATVALWPALFGDFVRGDLEEVARHPFVAGEPSLEELYAPDPLGRWRPLTLIAWKAGYLVGGGSAIGFHAVSLVVHLAAAGVALLLALRLTKSRLAAFFCATLFALHPVQVESVAWISALDVPLGGLFALAALHAHVRWRQNSDEGADPGLPSAAGIWLALALLASESALAVLPLVVAIDLGRPPASAVRARFRLKDYWPLAAGVLLWYGGRVDIYGGLAAGLDRAAFVYDVSPARLAWLRLEVVGGVARLLAWPAELTPSRPFVPSPESFSPATLAPLAFVVALGLATWWAWRRDRRPLLLALLWIPAAVLPAALRLRSLGASPLSDSLAYLATFGAALAATLVLSRLPRAVAIGALALLVAAAGTLAHRQTRVWHDDAHVLAATGASGAPSPAVEIGLGQQRLEAYRTGGDPELLREAFERFERALDLLTEARDDAAIPATREDHIHANLGLAWCLWYEAALAEPHDVQLAEAVFRQVAERYPEVAEAWIGLSVAQTAQGFHPDAETSLRRALEADPRSAQAWHNLGQLEVRRGRWREAAEAFGRAGAERPGTLDDLVWEARAWIEAGEPERARTALREARDRHPERAAPRVVEATLAASGGDLSGALELVREALELEPEDGEALLLKGKLHAARDEVASATTAFRAACDRLPESFEAHYNAGALLLSTRGTEVALPYLARAYRLRPEDEGDEGNEGGRRLAETLRQLDVRSPLVLQELAAEDARRGDDTSALEWVEAAIGAAPERIEPYVLKGELLARGGDDDAAIEVLRHACERDPEHLDAHVRLGNLLADHKNHEARYFLERALALARASSLPPATRRAMIEALRNRVETLDPHD